MGRLFGGGGLIIGAAGAGSLESPLDDEKVKKLEFLHDWDRQDMVENTYHLDGTVETYLWTRPARGNRSWLPVKVHASRLIQFPGATTTNRKRNQNQGWDLSVLQRVYATLKSFDSMFSSTDAMFADASQAVFKLQGLIDALGESDGSGENDVRTRLQLMDMMRSSGKAIMLDAGDENGDGAEDFSTVDRATLGSLDGTMQQYYIRLAAAAGMPLTVLLGMSPAGMDATGESDMILYYNRVDIYRKKVLEPRILRIVRMLARELGDEDPSEWKISWPELARPKPLDVATEAKMKVDACVALVTAQIALPEEVALSMNKIAPTLNLTLDKDSRVSALKEGLKEIANREMTGPGALPEEEPEGVSPPKKASERKTPSSAAKRQV
jgi:phage-related protein (TIGR01555 family)